MVTRSARSRIATARAFPVDVQRAIATDLGGFINMCGVSGSMLSMFPSAAMQERHDALEAGASSKKDPRWVLAALKEELVQSEIEQGPRGHANGRGRLRHRFDRGFRVRLGPPGLRTRAGDPCSGTLCFLVVVLLWIFVGVKWLHERVMLEAFKMIGMFWLGTVLTYAVIAGVLVALRWVVKSVRSKGTTPKFKRDR